MIVVHLVKDSPYVTSFFDFVTLLGVIIVF